MITTTIVKIKKNKELKSEYIESFFTTEGLDILRWAITDSDDDSFYLSIAMVID